MEITEVIPVVTYKNGLTVAVKHKPTKLRENKTGNFNYACYDVVERKVITRTLNTDKFSNKSSK